MSAAPKRLHEESASNEYHPSPFEPGQDGRLSKMPRTDSRDVDRRSPLHQMYRGVPQAGNDSFFDHPNTSEVRIDPKVDNRDSKLDADSQNLKGRGDASKDVKHDRDPHMDFRADSKTEKDAYYAANSHLNWKESREQHRGKRFPESANNGIDAWRTSRSTIQGTSEIARDSPIVEERGFSETHEAVGENKIDFRSDDKFRDKDRKKKDEKYKDWGERDKDRNDRRSNLQLGISSSEHREITREEREPERWERERKDTQKERERSKEREKKETVNGVDKEGSHIEKDSGEESARMSVQENPALEPKRQKDLDSCKASDKDSKDRRKEKDVELEGDKQENQSKCYDKESDDGFMEGEGGTERERESFSSGVQQRRRMLRPRGSPQMASREARFRSRSRDYEEAQEKAEVSTVVYKVGECMQELIKLWKEFEASQDNKNDESSLSGPTLEIQIAAEYVTATNRQVRGGQLWGTDIYTDDSDLVAVLMHTGYCRPTASPPPSAIKELCATIRVLPPQDSYTSTLRNNVRSRAWGAAIGCSYRVERCCIVKNGGGTIDLKPCLTHTSSVEPTLAPVTVERTMTTRAAASNALRQQRFVREVTIQYNLCNEPWIKYSISIVADKGLKKPLYTSARLKKGEVLYLETHSHRYELCFIGERTVSSITACQPSEMETDKSQTHNAQDQNGERSMADRETLVDVFRWSRCKKPLPQNIMRSIGTPLPPEHIEVLADNIDWEDVQWSQTCVWIAGKEYPLARVHFLSPN